MDRTARFASNGATAAILFLMVFPALSFGSSFAVPANSDEPDTWHKMNVPFYQVPVECSLALDEQDLPWIMFSTTNFSESGIFSLWFDGSGWTYQTIDPSICANAVNELLMAPGVLPQAVYRCTELDDSFKYAWRQNDYWHSETFGNSAGQGLDAALDSQGDIHVLFTDEDNYIQYATREGSNWIIEQIAYCSTSHIGLTLDSSDNPHAIWSESGSIYHCWHTSSGWHTETVAVTNAEDLDVAASQNKLHLIVQESSEVSYYLKTQAGWEYETIDAISGSSCAIAAASDGTVHAAYNDSTSADLMYAARSPSGWAIQVLAWDGNYGNDVSLLLDSSENPWMCYSSDYNSYELAWWAPDTTSVHDCEESISLPAMPIAFSQNPLYSSGTIQLEIQQPGNYQLSILDVSGREIVSLLDGYIEPAAYDFQINSMDFCAGTFIVLLKGNGFCFSERMLILRD